MSEENSSTPSTVSTVAADVSEVASIAAPIASLAGPYGLLASTALNIIQMLASNAPEAYAVISKAFTKAAPTQADFEALKAEVAALSLDS